MKNSFWFFLLLFIAFSCNGREVYMQYMPVENGSWHKDSVVNFDINIEDTTTVYNLYVNIRNRGEYPYQNLWLFIQTTGPDSMAVSDTIAFYLADRKGKWLGTGIGAAFDMPVLYRQNFRFYKQGTYKFTINHGMRDSVLTGISDVGMRLERNQLP